jgi:hypothetical protein
MLATERGRSLRASVLAALASLALLASDMRAARAADWPMIQGTEPASAGVVRPFGFVQVTGEALLGGRVHGLTSPALAKYEGERPAFNALESGGTWGLAVRRARPGLRGAVPGTGGRVSYFMLAELGSAAIARNGPTLTDAAITLSYVPGARLRLGQFKLPVMDEAVEANPVAAEWVNFSLSAASLVNENRVRDGKYDGGASGFRDVGAEVFDTFQRGHLALAYAVMLSNGRRGFTDDDASKDVTGRTTLSWVFSGAPTDPHRQELSVFAWGQRGERTLAGASVQRIRSGAGVLFEKAPLRVRAELVYASGALLLGPNPPFAGQPLVMDPHGRALGGYLQTSLRVFRRARVGLRYDELHRQLDDARAERVFRTLSPMLEYDVVPRVRLQATYEWRWLDAPEGTADAKSIARAMGDRAALQATVIF